MNLVLRLVSMAALVVAAIGCDSASTSAAEIGTKKSMTTTAAPANSEFATFGGGCFWCIEAVFQELRGVYAVESGYAGGHVENPTYEQVASRRSGHAEVARVQFDPAVISYADLVTVFYHLHDPTTLNRQGNDIGPEYRSIILYESESQRETAARVTQEVADSKLWSDPIVTTIEPLTKFYPAEDEHQDYYANNQSKPYCLLVIGPKIQKLRKEFADKLK